MERTTDHAERLTGFARGRVAAADLPLDDKAFWRTVFESAAHPGRAARSSLAAAAAERLLHRPLTKKQEDVRENAAIDALASSDRGTRRQAMRFLHAIEEPDSAVLTAAAGVAHDADVEVRMEAARLLAQHPSGQTLPALLGILESADDFRETIASEAVVDCGEAALPGLTRMLANDDARIRWRAARCMSKIAPDAGRAALPGLLTAFHDDSPNVAWVAADGLLALGPDADKDVLRSVLAERLTGVTIRALHHYAEFASPVGVFKPLAQATARTGAGSSTLMAVDAALRALEAQV